MKFVLVALVAIVALASQTQAANTCYFGGVQTDCNCVTDVERVPSPVKLINGGASAFESGVFANDLVLGFELDGKYFVANTSTASSGTVFVTGSTNNDVSVDKLPEIEIRASNNVATCVWKTPGLTGGKGNFAVTRGKVDATSCGTDASATVVAADTNKLVVTVPLTTALDDCQFTTTTHVPVNGALFTEYTAKVVVKTTEAIKPIRGTALYTYTEAPFTITVRFPESVTVTSSNVTVIGQVVTQSAITHQIWNTATKQLDLNLYTSATYPYQMNHDDTTSWGTYTAAGYPVPTANFGAAPWGNLLALNSTTGLNVATTGTFAYPTLVFDQTNNGASIDDFFVFNNATAFIIDASASDKFNPNQVLPTATCTTEATSLCLQNTHIRLTPRSPWCDVNFLYTLTMRVGCRSDIAGCDTASIQDKFVKFYFSTSSDNFCPRVVATASLQGQVGIYDSTAWGGVESGVAGYPGLAGRKTQNQFVFGQKLYVETFVGADAGINIDKINTEAIYITTTTASGLNSNTLPTTTFTNNANDNWGQKVYSAATRTGCDATAATAYGCADGIATSYVSGEQCLSYLSSSDTVSCKVAVSDRVADDGQSTAFDALGGVLPTSNTNTDGTLERRAGTKWEGVTRAVFVADKYTIRIDPANQEAPSGATIWVYVSVTYKDANQQQSVRHFAVKHDTTGTEVVTMATTGATNARAQVGVRGLSSSGSSSSSTLFGLSSTTVLGVAIAIGGVIAFAAIALVVSRRRSHQPQPVKSSSSAELTAVATASAAAEEDATNQA